MVGGKAARRLALEVLGWTLVVLGIAALVLPGPGLLMLFGGLAVLSQQYTWAERRVRPVERAAKKAAAESVQTWPRIAASLLGVVWLTGLGVVWGLRPPAPEWWPLRESWWLLGGWGTGATLIASAAIALAMIVYSFGKYRGLTEEQIVAEVEMSSRGNSTT
jgi:uncharacterized protein (TIGR02611 family)